MRDTRGQRVLADIARIRVAERAAARHALLLAEQDEKQAAIAVRDADARTAAAAQDWHAHLAGPFAPELARALAGEVVRLSGAGAEAEHGYRSATVAREGYEGNWHDADARCRQADRSLAENRRLITRAHDNRRLDIAADRTTQLWSMR